MIRNVGLAIVFGVAAATTGHAQTTQPKDVDIMFVVDQSGSMANEFRTLGANTNTFFTGLQADPRVGSVAAGLVSYDTARNGIAPNELVLHQSITTSAPDLASAFNGVSVTGGTEDALSAVASVLPDGVLFGQAGWRNNTVKSIVLVTDEDADDAGIFTNAFGTGYAALGAQLDSVGFLNNVITESSLFSVYGQIAKPAGALFDIDDFTGAGADPVAFLNAFVAAKADEIATTPTTPSTPNVVPVPAALPLMAGALAALGLVGRRRRAA